MLSLTNLGYGGAGLNDRLPAILAELQGHTISGPVAGAGANVPIAVPGIDLGDTLQKVLVFTAGVPSDQTINASIVDRRASGTLTLLATLANGDVVKVNGKTYTFQAIGALKVNPSTNLAPYVVPILVDPVTGLVDLVDTADALAVAIMSADSTLTCISLGAVVTVLFQTPGVAGNAVTLDVTLSNAHVTSSAANLAGGTATQGIVITGSTVGTSIVVFWYNRSPAGLVPL